VHRLGLGILCFGARFALPPGSRLFSSFRRAADLLLADLTFNHRPRTLFAAVSRMPLHAGVVSANWPLDLLFVACFFPWWVLAGFRPSIRI
jgi:hypothetical protein